MALLLFLYVLIILGLAGVAIYEHITISTLSLPVSPALTILTILLPLLFPLTTLTTPLLFHHSPPTRRKRTTTTSSPLLGFPNLPPLLLSLAQFMLTTILTTLYTTTLTSPTTTTCLLTQKWSHLWKSHDARAIQTIQDSLSCCGFRSTRDMAWPFPRGAHPDRGACETQFGRHTACLPGWEGVLRRAVGGEVAVVVCIGLLQVLTVVLVGRGVNTRRGFGWDWDRGEGWVRGLERFWGGSSGRGRVEEGRRPLLEAGDGTERDGYQEVVDEEVQVTPEGRESEEVEQRRGTEGYGAVEEAGPRVEPAHHDPWAGVQRG